jgi:hypothetical protein
MFLVSRAEEILYGISFFLAISGCIDDTKSQSISLPAEWFWDTCDISELVISELPVVDRSWQKTSIPHRVFLPDQSIWYTTAMAPDGNHYLYVDADDGAQVFFNHKQCQVINGYYYDLPGMIDSAWLSIRVLNNAMWGGLRNVQWVDRDSMDNIWSEQRDSIAQLEEIFGVYGKDIFLPPNGYQVHTRSATRFTCWGDSQGGWDVFQSLCHLMGNIPRIDFSIGLGDLVSDGVDVAQWYSLFTCLTLMVEKGIPVYPIPGNHDYDGYYDDLIPANYRRLFTNEGQLTYTFWSAGPACFMALDPNSTFPLSLDSIQLAWAVDRMHSKTWREAAWRFILIHQPPYSQGWPGYEGDAFIRSFVAAMRKVTGLTLCCPGIVMILSI